jgi:photosystem II stability/assembly factor-like uncharacterized protein
MILRYEDGAFERMDTPGTETVFGIWGSAPDDLWAVGGASESTAGFAWRYDGSTWSVEPSVPADVSTDSALWKVFGTRSDDAWLVGSNGVALHWNGSTLTPGQTGVGTSLFTVHEAGGRYVAVGGTASGIIVEYDGSTWTDVSPRDSAQGLAGVALTADGDGLAVGMFGGVYRRTGGAWEPESLGIPVRADLHAAWIDDEGGLWAVGGQTFSYPLTDGIMLYKGTERPGGTDEN